MTAITADTIGPIPPTTPDERDGATPCAGRWDLFRTLPERMKRHVQVQGECHVWTGALRNNYAVIGVYRDGRSVAVEAHRVAYELANGDIPDGLWIDHLCRNKRCVNPAHLEAVTPGENTRRGWAARSPIEERKRTQSRKRTQARQERRDSEDAAFDADSARAANAAYRRGERSEWAIAGRRVYARHRRLVRSGK